MGLIKRERFWGRCEENRTRKTQIERMNTDLISEHLHNPRHQRSITTVNRKYDLIRRGRCWERFEENRGIVLELFLGYCQMKTNEYLCNQNYLKDESYNFHIG